jgi:hypothetical protein
MAQAGAFDTPPAQAGAEGESAGLYTDSAHLSDDKLAQTVHRIISERIEDGQLDECDLTVRDIARIQEAFVNMLKGIYHPRVQYPGAQAGQQQEEAVGKEQEDAVVAPPTSPLMSNGVAQTANGYGNGHGATLNGAATGVESGLEATQPSEASR